MSQSFAETDRQSYNANNKRRGEDIDVLWELRLSGIKNTSGQPWGKDRVEKDQGRQLQQPGSSTLKCAPKVQWMKLGRTLLNGLVWGRVGARQGRVGLVHRRTNTACTGTSYVVLQCVHTEQPKRPELTMMDAMWYGRAWVPSKGDRGNYGRTGPRAQWRSI
jgi:hypothetical protein